MKTCHLPKWADPSTGECEHPAHEFCVVCLVGNGDLDHDCADHQVVDYHEADEVPTSEPCAGVDECPDCKDVVRQVEEFLNA